MHRQNGGKEWKLLSNGEEDQLEEKLGIVYVSPLPNADIFLEKCRYYTSPMNIFRHVNHPVQARY